MNAHTIQPEPLGVKNRSRIVNVGELLGPRGEIKLDFRGEEYCLRITRNDKLILTK